MRGTRLGCRRSWSTMMVAVGDMVPDASFALADGTTATLADWRGKSLVLFFYPKDDTSGCTTEAKAFSALLPDFAAAGVAVLGASRDSVASHAKFIARAQPHDPARRRYRGRADDGIRRLGRKIDVRPHLYGHRAVHLPHRWRRPHCANLAQGESAGTCRIGARIDSPTRLITFCSALETIAIGHG